MLKSGLLTEETRYVMLDLEKLERICIQSSLKKQLCGLKQYKDFAAYLCREELENQMNGWVCLYPEQLDANKANKIIVVTMEEFESNLGSMKYWKPFFDVSVLRQNSKAYFRYCSNSKLGRFDGVQDDSFTEIPGIDKYMSAEIFNDLKELNVISDDGCGTNLIACDISPLSVRLTKHLEFETEILNVLRKNLAYRLALNEFRYSGDTDLVSEPHYSLFADLIEDGLVTPCRVADSLTLKNIEESINEWYGKTFSKDHLAGICKTGENVDELWEELIDVKWLKYICSTEEKADIVIKNRNTGRLQKFKHIQEILKLYLLLFKRTSEKKCSLCQCLYSLKSDLSKVEDIDSSLLDVYHLFDVDMIYQTSYELNVFSGNGLNHIFTLSEANYMWKTLFRAGAIGLIGVSQIALGAILELYTVGFGTMISNGLVTEGFGDITFAIESAFRGQCTWETYFQHKKMSVSISVLTLGIGAYYARGAKFSRYGYKIGGDFLTEMSGVNLLRQAGTKVVLRKVAFRASKKIFEAGCFALANSGVDWIVQNKLDDCTKTVSAAILSVIDNKDISKGSLYSSLCEICSKIGIERARSLIETTNIELWLNSSKQSELSCQVASQLLQLGGAITSGLGQAIQKLHKSSSQVGNQKSLSNFLAVFDKIVKRSSTGKLVNEISKTVDIFWNNLDEQLRQQCQNLNGIDASHFDTDIEIFCSNVIYDWKVTLHRMMQDKISNDVLCPILQKYTKQILVYTASAIKRSYKQFRTNRLKKEFLKLKLKSKQSLARLQDSEAEFSTTSLLLDQVQAEYHAELIKLLQKTKDPHLFAEIIREGVPVGIHCIQAVTEIIGIPIEINTIGGDGTMVIPPRFVPSDDNFSTEPVVLNFHVGENGSYGHFEDPDNEMFAENSAKYDCLFDAVNSKLSLTLSRDDVANVIETNPVIRDRISKGIHGHFIQKGAVGGSSRLIIRLLTQLLRICGSKSLDALKPTAANNIGMELLMLNCVGGVADDVLASGIKKLFSILKSKIAPATDKNIAATEEPCTSLDTNISHEDIINILLKKYPHLWRDQSKFFQGSIKRTGLDELLQISKLQEWLIKALTENKGVYKNSTYDILSVMIEFRISTKYVNWIFVDPTGKESLHGHSGSLYGQRIGNTLSKQLTKGQPNFHWTRSEEAFNAKGAPDVLEKAVKAHLKKHCPVSS